MAQNSQLLQLAQDPATPLLTLQQLAQEYPGLRPAIALNPSTYPALLGWLADLHDPAVDAALAQRAAGGLPAPPLPAGAPTATAGAGGASAAAQNRPAGNAGRADGNPLFPPTQSLPVAGAQGILDFEDDDEPSGGGILPWVIGGLAVVLVLVILYVVFTLFGPNKTVQPQVADSLLANTQSPETAESTQEAAPGSATPTPSASTQLRPAPTDALEMSAFYTPSENIGCSLEGEAAWCVMYEHNETTSAGCGPDEPVIVTIDLHGNISEECASAEGDLPILDYGYSTANENFACVSKETGVDCWHLATGRGFDISREGIFKK